LANTPLIVSTIGISLSEVVPGAKESTAQNHWSSMVAVDPRPVIDKLELLHVFNQRAIAIANADRVPKVDHISLLLLLKEFTNPLFGISSLQILQS
jgi:hypothetical protein